MIGSSELVRVLLMNTIGQSILIETLKSAHYFITHSNGFDPKHHVTKRNFLDSKQCYFFMQGTGLDTLIQSYELDYNPETLRDGFNYYARHS